MINKLSNIKDVFKSPPLDGWEAEIWNILKTISDPEIPVLSVVDLGIVRDVKVVDELIEVVITPTYTGCPAMDMIAMNVRLALIEHGYLNIKITSVLSPAWTTDWMSEKAKQQLKEYGIAPPKGNVNSIIKDGIECPQCNSTNTSIISEFGSTACKALFKCNDCKEPFDYFKCY